MHYNLAAYGFICLFIQRTHHHYHHREEISIKFDCRMIVACDYYYPHIHMEWATIITIISPNVEL